MTSKPSDMFPWLWPFSALQGKLTQDILPERSLISITENNSSAPDTERRIVAQESYGRQIGRIMDAVCALVVERPSGAADNKAFSALEELQKRVEATKVEAANDQLARVRDDLEILKVEDPHAYDEQMKALHDLLQR